MSLSRCRALLAALLLAFAGFGALSPAQAFVADRCAGVVCQPLDSCHVAGVCDPSTGTCTNPPKQVGDACDDGNACTTGDHCVAIPCEQQDSVLWIGHDGAQGFSKIKASDGTLLQTTDIAGTGTAWDGTHLFFDSTGGTINEREPDGVTNDATYSTGAYGSPTEDFTYDTVRKRLWRVDHNPPTLVKIDPVSRLVEAHYPLSTNDTDPEIVPRGTLGVAYDSLRDVLYVSFCREGCSSGTIGQVIVVQPDTGVEVGTLFYTHGFMTGGLAYDPISDTVWVGSNDGIHNMSRTGNVLRTIPMPGAGFPDGVEFIPACAAGQVQCVGTAVNCVGDQCRNGGSCDPSTGQCSGGNKPDGTQCSDGDNCTSGDSCQAGKCVGAAVSCQPPDACHDAGTCDPSNGACSNPPRKTNVCLDLGPAGGFNLFARGSVTGSSSDVDGAVAGTDVTYSNYSVGAKLPAGGTALVAAGALKFSGGQIGGKVFYGKTSSISQATVLGAVAQGAPFDFTAAGAQLLSASAQLAALPANGTTTLQWGGIYLSGSDAKMNVFTVPATALGSTWGVNLRVPASSVAVINVTGTSARMQYFGFDTAGQPRSNIVFNFPSATSLTIQGIGVEGSILAPSAAVSFANGQINGQLFAASVSGGGQSNSAPLGCVPICR